MQFPSQCEVWKWAFDLSIDSSAEGKGDVLLSLDACSLFAVDSMSSLNFFSLEFTDFCCREDMEIVFSLVTTCSLIVTSFSAVFSPLISLISVTICLGAGYYRLWTRPRVSEGLEVLFTIRHNGDCCLCLGQVCCGWNRCRNAEHVLEFSYLQFS